MAFESHVRGTRWLLHRAEHVRPLRMVQHFLPQEHIKDPPGEPTESRSTEMSWINSEPPLMRDQTWT